MSGGSGHGGRKKKSRPALGLDLKPSLERAPGGKKAPAFGIDLGPVIEAAAHPEAIEAAETEPVRNEIPERIPVKEEKITEETPVMENADKGEVPEAEPEVKSEEKVPEKSAQEPARKPLRKLVKVRKDQPAQQYHGLHEAPSDNEIVPDRRAVQEYHGKHEAEPEKPGKTKKFSWKDFIIKSAAITLSLCIIAVLILTMPIIWFDDKRDGTKKNVSILYYLKNEQFLGYIEGNIDKTKHDPNIDTDIVTPDYDDGLDLPQKIEGQFTVLFLGFDEDVTNTDVMWVLQFDIRGGKLNILQIPRDTFMPDYTSNPNGKANSIYNFGREDVNPPIQRVVDAVEENFFIPIDAYITTVCTDIVNIVDLIGGIPIHLDERILYDPENFPDKIVPAGDTVLTGEQAEWFIRYRGGWLEGDIGRMKNQRRFMAAAMKKLTSIVDEHKGKSRLYRYLNEIRKNEWIATDMSVGDLTKLGDFAGTLSMEDVRVNMVPGEGTPNDAPYVGRDGGEYSIYSVHKQETIDMLNKYFMPYQHKIVNTSIVEYITDHTYSFYDDTDSTLAELEDATEPERNPLAPK